MGRPGLGLSETLVSLYPSMELLKYAYLHVQDTILSKSRQFVRDPLPRKQIHHDEGLHWVCSSVDVEGNVRVYDSLATGRTSQELKIQLALLYDVVMVS
ncbi:hypothetical protein LOD99_11121 [Oopsacas minuta]|uniref:Uncharacterized protein n=1 Tax=Oopsacas minuta TaxID=111878 RepID=A0AAV7KC10_9METZ|nr:hypothetical protein LOD99_11121 [Oopsacas minuta]